MATLIADKYEANKAEVNARFDQLRANEEELNRIFAKIYNMEDEVPIEVEDKYVSVARIFDTAEEIPESFKGNKYVRTKRDEIVSLLSYAVGCMFGRYSLDVDGLVLADQGDTFDNYLAKMPDPAHVTFMPNAVDVLPLTQEPYFDDDVITRLETFLTAAYGPETLEDNLRFIADALSGDSTDLPRDVIRDYFVREFFADHCRTYKKRPIYWQLDSGKKNGFKALLYLHRYTPDLLARVRTDYVHELQERYRGRLAQIEISLADAKGRKRAELNRDRKAFEAKADELGKYEELIHHLADQMIPLDLDDGVKVNYAKFGKALTAVK